MKYTVTFKCLDDDNLSLEHNTNDYDQAVHFFWAMVTKLKTAHDKIDTHSWELTMRINGSHEMGFKYHFSKM